MTRSPTCPTLEAWILGRIARHRSMQNSMPAQMLEKPPEYLFVDFWDVRDKLRELRDAGLIHAVSRRFYLTKKGRARRAELAKAAQN